MVLCVKLARSFTAILAALTWTGFAYAGAGVGTSQLSVANLLKAELAQLYPGARIQLYQDDSSNILPSRGAVTILGEDGQGHVRFSVQGSQPNTYVERTLKYSVWSTAYMAIRRVRPGELLDPANFSQQKVDLALGTAREYRGVIIPPSTELSRYEAAQTIMEGQLLVSTSMRQVPQVRRGDSVHVQVRSGGLTISTEGTALEPSYIGRTLRVQTLKAKRELTGHLLEGGIVEVQI